jgi:two-component system C4-dicarboxylate transport sensor histidine kinase DctB
LGNHVNSLKITLDVLEENYDFFDDMKKREYLKRGVDLVSRQERLVEAMKSYSSFNAKEQQEIPFHNFWQHFLTAATEKLKNEKITLIHKLEAGPCLIRANNMALHKVMMNLFDNCIEAVEGVADPKIELRASSNDDTVMIVIKDNGSGISQDDVPKIFIPLYTTKKGKMGMGLPVARKLLLKMGGRIRVDRPLGVGTEIKVWLGTVDGSEKESIRYS